MWDQFFEIDVAHNRRLILLQNLKTVMDYFDTFVLTILLNFLLPLHRDPNAVNDAHLCPEP